MIDALGDIVRRAKVMGRLDFQATLFEECGVAFCEQDGGTRYHIVVGGDCWAMIDGAPTPLNLTSVSLLIVPRGARHAIAGSIDAPIEDKSAFDAHRKNLRGCANKVAECGNNMSAPTSAARSTIIVSGVFEMDRDFGDLLVKELPDYLHLSLSERDDLGWLADAVRFVCHEVSEGAPGGAAIADRLSQMIFIETIKSFAESASTGVIASLRDPNIGAAFTAFHRAPANDWTVAKLAKAAGLSRTLFAARANALLGMTPMMYVRDWRLMLARRLLRETARDIEAIAREVGYGSASTFVKAYRDYYGVEPRRERE